MSVKKAPLQVGDYLLLARPKTNSNATLLEDGVLSLVRVWRNVL